MSTLNRCRYALESFYYIEERYMDFYKSRDLFILDSGAFTFLSNTKNTVDWDAYVRKYIDFINRHKIDLFFEMDIDKIVGLPKVEEYREIIERATGKRCIPVWHKSRGLDYWERLCREYDYVAIGGIAIKDIPRQHYQYFHEFLRIARKHRTKVHALGFSGRDVANYDFYSVDSSTWNSGARYGQFHYFDGRAIRLMRPEGKRGIASALDQHNFLEWCAFQRHLEGI